MHIYVPRSYFSLMANGRHQVGLVDRQGGLPWDTPLGLVLTVIEATAMLMLLTGVFERTWPKPFKPISRYRRNDSVVGSASREFGGPQTCGRQTPRRVNMGNEGRPPDAAAPGGTAASFTGRGVYGVHPSLEAH